MGRGAQRERPSRTWDLHSYQHWNTNLCYEQPKQKGRLLQKKSHGLRKTNKNISYSEQSCSLIRCEVVALTGDVLTTSPQWQLLVTWAACTTRLHNREVAILWSSRSGGPTKEMWLDFITKRPHSDLLCLHYLLPLPGPQLDCVFAKYKTCAKHARFWRPWRTRRNVQTICTS